MGTAEGEFHVRNGNPNFLCREGPAMSREPYAQKKLCFTATDRELLARHLLALSKRDDCVFVKFGVKPRGGMFLGRCFMLTEEAVGELWALYKTHPAIYCTIQDDDFAERFRERCEAYDRVWLDADQQSPEVLAAARLSGAAE
jgi:hypothetical protein